MFFPPVVVTIPQSDVKELLTMIDTTFGPKYTTIMYTAKENVSVYIEFGHVKKNKTTEEMLECIRNEGVHTDRFILHAQVF